MAASTQVIIAPLSYNGPELYHFTDLWFNDATVTLQAGSTLFRIYAGILALHSSVFRDMFAFPQPAPVPGEDKMPCVMVHDDPRDLYYFLMTLHKSGYYETHSLIDSDLILSVLRLSTKYDVPFYRKQAIAQISEVFPTTLRQWDMLRNVALPPSLSRALWDLEDRCVEVANLARECDLPSILPSALYACATTYDVGALLDKVSGLKGSQVELSEVDKRPCIAATAHLRRQFSKYNLAKIREVPTFMTCQCIYPGDCSAAALRVLSVFASGESVDYPLDDFPSWAFREAAGNGVPAPPELCQACKAVIEEGFERARVAAWQNLPGVFNLGKWEDLTTFGK